MIVSTLVVGHVPFPDGVIGKKPRELRDDRYFKELLSCFNLGDLHFAERANYQEAIKTYNPFIVVVFDDVIAEEIKTYKKEVFLYVTKPPSTIFSRKAEVITRQEEQRKTFKEIAWLVQKIKDDGEEKQEQLRKVSGMGYKETYDMLIQMIIGDDEDLQRRTWDLLNDNTVRSDFRWMRAQLLLEVWLHGDGKGKEEFLCMAMDQHITNGMAHKIENFTDAEGQEYHQYIFHFFDGTDANYIRRIPIGDKGQDKYAYEAILTKYETPNGLQMMMEAGQLKAEKEKYQKEA